MNEAYPAEVARFRYRHEAELASGYLADAGIRASVIAHDADPIQFGQHFGAPARVLVREEDAERARRVLADAGMEVYGGEEDPLGSPGETPER